MGWIFLWKNFPRFPLDLEQTVWWRCYPIPSMILALFRSQIRMSDSVYHLKISKLDPASHILIRRR